MLPFRFGAHRSRSHVHARPALPPPLALLAMALIGLGLILPFLAPPVQAQGEPGSVYVISVTGTIDLGLAPYLDRVIDQAAEEDAAAVLVEIDTPGGRLDAVLQMKDSLLASEVPTIAFVNRTAFSAGALVAIACEQIYMATGGVMGAATPISGATGETADEKTVSAVRSTFAATAEARGRDPLVAEAMVDPDVEIQGLSPEGQLLTLTSAQALNWDYADAVLDTRAEVLAAAGFADAPVVETEPNWSERLVRFITDPIVASLLMLGGLLLIVGDFFVEGLGITAVVGAGLLALFFWGHMLAGIAGWEDAALVILGVVLIGVELLVIPGFGIPGVLGLIALLGGFFLALVSRDIRTPEQTERALTMVGLVFAGLVVGVIALLVLLPRNRTLGRLVLADHVGGPIDGRDMERPQAKPRGWLNWFGGGRDLVLPAEHQMVGEPQDAPRRSWTGARGVALSDLRPSGIGEFEGQRVDIVTDGEFIPAGQPIEIVRDEIYRRVVRRVRD